MQSPSYSGLPKRKSNIGLIIGIVVAALFVCCGGAGYFALQAGKKIAGNVGTMITCAATLTDYRKALLTYAGKHGGKLPPAATWQKDVQPYLVKTEMPEVLRGDSGASSKPDVCDPQAQTGVCLNSKYAGKPISAVPADDDGVVVFEISGVKENQAQPFKRQPFATSPLFFGNHRGWIEQPLFGTAAIVDASGRRSPIAVQGTGAKVGN